MQHPVEIKRKKTRLLWLAALGLGLATLLTWERYDKLVALSWDSLLPAASILLVGVPGLTALAALVISLFSHEPYLLVYDDRIEMPRLLSRNCRVLHFCDVKSMKKTDKDKALFCLQPYLKRSDLPSWTGVAKRFLSADFGISLSAIDMPPKEAYELIFRCYRHYHHLDRHNGKETDANVIDRYLARRAERQGNGKWRP